MGRSLVVLSLVYIAAHSAAASPAELTVEYLTNPLGVDVSSPRFSWINTATSGARGITQTSYQIQAYLSAEFENLVWDSGEVKSDASNLVEFPDWIMKGTPPTPKTKYYWRVSTALSDGSPASWSETATFTTGLFKDSDWQGASWITGGDSKNLLRSTAFTVDAADLSKNDGMLYVSGIGYHEVYINGVKVGDHKLDSSWSDNAKRNYYASHEISSYLEAGDNVVGVMMGNGWFSCDKSNPYGPTSQPGCTDAPPQLMLALFPGGAAKAVVSDTSWTATAGPITSVPLSLRRTNPNPNPDPNSNRSYNSLYNGEHYDARLEIEGITLTLAYT